MKKVILIFLWVCAGLSGCYYDNYTELYPAVSLTSGCDTINPVTYSKQITSIMSGYCTSCHSGNTVNGNVVLDNYTGTMNSAASGKMVASLRHQSGHPAMPPNTQMDECSIREVELWIEGGYAQ